MNDKTCYPASNDEPTSAIIPVTPTSVVPQEANSDAQIIELWLHGRSRHTQRAYRADAERLVAFLGIPFGQMRLLDLQGFADSLQSQGTAPASRHRTLSAVKSLFSFAHGLGYLPFDTAKPLRLPPIRDRLSERILEEAEVQRMLALEPNPRNAAILYLLYGAGIRAAELCGLRWSDVQARNEGAQVSVLGKGAKTRVVLIPPSVKARLDAIRGGAPDEAPVFVSRKRKPISASQLLRVVKAAAKRAGVNPNTSTHWLRHSHASHSLDRGCPISLVQTSLGHASLTTTGRYLHARPNDGSSRYLAI